MNPYRPKKLYVRRALLWAFECAVYMACIASVGLCIYAAFPELKWRAGILALGAIWAVEHGNWKYRQWESRHED